MQPHRVSITPACGTHEMLFAEEKKDPSTQQAISWLSAAWGSISEDLIESSFLTCDISDNIDGSEDTLSGTVFQGQVKTKEREGGGAIAMRIR